MFSKYLKFLKQVYRQVKILHLLDKVNHHYLTVSVICQSHILPFLKK